VGSGDPLFLFLFFNFIFWFFGAHLQRMLLQAWENVLMVQSG
jgi:hypothetical protein